MTEPLIAQRKYHAVKIVQMSSSTFGEAITIIGLGDDGMVYNWSYAAGCWLKQWKISQ